MANSKDVKSGKKAIKDLPVRDVEAAKARMVAGGKGASVSEIQITKVSDKSSAL